MRVLDRLDYEYYFLPYRFYSLLQKLDFDGVDFPFGGELHIVAVDLAEVGVRVVRSREVVALELYRRQWEQILLEACLAIAPSAIGMAQLLAREQITYSSPHLERCEGHSLTQRDEPLDKSTRVVLIIEFADTTKAHMGLMAQKLVGIFQRKNIDKNTLVLELLATAVLLDHRVTVTHLGIGHNIVQVVLVGMQNVVIVILEHLQKAEIVLAHHLDIEVVIPRNKATVTHCTEKRT